MSNLVSFCGLVDSKIRAFDKDSPLLLKMAATVFPHIVSSLE